MYQERGINIELQLVTNHAIYLCMENLGLPATPQFKLSKEG